MNDEHTEKGGQRPDELSQLRRQARLNELKLKVARQNEALAGLHRAGYRDTLEGFYDPGNFFDPRDYLFEQVPLFGAIPTTRNDRDEGRDYPVFRTEQDLALIRGAARLVVNSNPTALGILTALTNYVVGNGFQYTVTARRSGAAEIAAKASVLVREFLDENDWSGDLDRELFQRSRVDGEYFLALWHMGGGHVQARAVEPDQVTEPSNKLGLEEWLGRRSSVSLDRVVSAGGIDARSSETLDLRDSWTFGVHTDHVDAQEIHGYYVQWTNRDTEWNYFPGGNAPLIPPDGPGAWMLHAKLNVVRAVKRGLSDFYPVQGNLDLARRVLRNMGEGSAVQAAIAWIQETAPGTTQAQTHSGTLARADAQYSTRSASGGSRQHLVQQYDPATILKVPYGQKYLPGPLGAQNAPSFVTSAEAILRTVALRWNLPEHLVTGTAENNNFSSSLVAETPFVKYAESQQQFYAQRDRKTLWQVLKFGWQAGRFGNVPWSFVRRSLDITVTPPQIEVRDPEKETRVRQMLHEAGVLSRKTWSAQEGLDFEQEERNLQQEAAAESRSALTPARAAAKPESGADALNPAERAAGSRDSHPPNALPPGMETEDQDSEPCESRDSLEGPWDASKHPRGGYSQNRGWFSRAWSAVTGRLRRRSGDQRLANAVAPTPKRISTREPIQPTKTAKTSTPTNPPRPRIILTAHEEPTGSGEKGARLRAGSLRGELKRQRVPAAPLPPIAKDMEKIGDSFDATVQGVAGLIRDPRKYAKDAADVLKGYAIDAPFALIQGLTHALVHPRESAAALIRAAKDPVQAAKSVAGSLAAPFVSGNLREQGKAAFDIVTALLPAPAEMEQLLAKVAAQAPEVLPAAKQALAFLTRHSAAIDELAAAAAKFYSHGQAGALLTGKKLVELLDKTKAMGVRIFDGIDAAGKPITRPAFHIIEEGGQLVPALDIPRRGITDVAFDEELIHYGQAVRSGFKEFQEIQKAGPLISLLLDRGDNWVRVALLKTGSKANAHQMLDNAIRYAELEKEAQILLLQNPILKGNYRKKWPHIEGHLSKLRDQWTRTIKRLNDIKAKIK